MIAIPTPTAEAAIRPMVRATMMTASTTAKSKTVARDSMKRSGSRSIMRMPMTIRMPASAATGIQARKEPKTQCGDQRQQTFEYPRDPRYGAAVQVDQGGAHGAGAGDAADCRRGDVGDPLSHQFAIGLVPGARQLVDDDAGLQGVDREQGGERQRAAEQAGDLPQAKVADLMPAPGNRAEIALHRGAQRTDDQMIAGYLPERRVLSRQTDVGQ